MDSITTKEKLKERIKELSCLYSISTIFLKELTIEETLIEISKIVKIAWRYPHDAHVEIQLDTFYVLTDSLAEANVSQGSTIKVFDKKAGFIKVHYASDKFTLKQFLKDEQELLNNISIKIGSFYEKYLNSKELEKYKSKTQHIDRLSILGEITAGIAHELNTPLGNILGFAELILNRTEDNQIKQDISKVIKASIYSREIVKKLMFFSCEIPQNMKIISLKPIILEVLTLLEPNFKKKNLSYKFTISDDGLVAQFDTIQLMQVLFNILVNSIYVSPEASTISVVVSKDEFNFCIEIIDCGPGLLEEIKPKIFEPFYTTKPVGEGTGLGLSVVHGIIKNHKGTITILNNKPTGCNFKISLPLTHK